jgi:hypothetical protein
MICNESSIYGMWLRETVRNSSGRFWKCCRHFINKRETIVTTLSLSKVIVGSIRSVPGDISYRGNLILVKYGVSSCHRNKSMRSWERGGSGQLGC